MKSAYTVVGKPEKNRQLGLGWKCNMDVDITEIGYEGAGKINLAHNRARWRSLLNIN
jgi:hypothetical protein